MAVAVKDVARLDLEPTDFDGVSEVDNMSVGVRNGDAPGE